MTTVVISGASRGIGLQLARKYAAAGAQVIAGVRARQLGDVDGLGVSRAVALDDDAAMASLQAVDGVADTVGGETAAKLLSKVRPGGRFGYASVLPQDASAANPTVAVSRVFARPDPSKLREFADDVRDGRFVSPVSQRLPLSDAAAAQELVQKGGAGKIVLLI